jgi:hypothetical protein
VIDSQQEGPFVTRLLAVVPLLLLGADPSFAADRPNVLLIVSEDNGPELGCYGDPYARTPNLDRLAAEGTRFERAFVPFSGLFSVAGRVSDGAASASERSDRVGDPQVRYV